MQLPAPSWESAEVIKTSSQPRSYIHIIETANGQLRRNRRDLRPSPTASSLPCQRASPAAISQPAAASEADESPPQRSDLTLRRSTRESKPPVRLGNSSVNVSETLP